MKIKNIIAVLIAAALFVMTYSVATVAADTPNNAALKVSLSERTVEWNPSKAIKIMPLGDSITDYDACWWRVKLYAKLAAAGYNINFVGTRNGSVGPATAHEGVAGATSTQRLNDLDAVLAANIPDIMMINLGTNDLSNNIVHKAADNIKKIIEKSRTYKSDMIFFVTLISPAATNPRGWELNYLLQRIAPEASNETSPVIIVDQFLGFDTVTMQGEEGRGPHPNEIGGEWLANNYFEKVKKVLDGIIPPDFPINSSLKGPDGFSFCSFESHSNDVHAINFSSPVDIAWGVGDEWVYQYNVTGDVYFNGNLGNPANMREKFGFYRSAAAGAPTVTFPPLSAPQNTSFVDELASLSSDWGFSASVGHALSGGDLVLRHPTTANNVAVNRKFERVDMTNSQKMTFEMKFKLGDNLPTNAQSFPTISDSNIYNYWASPISIQLLGGDYKINGFGGGTTFSGMLKPNHKYISKIDMDFGSKQQTVTLTDLTDDVSQAFTGALADLSERYTGFDRATFWIDSSNDAIVKIDYLRLKSVDDFNGASSPDTDEDSDGEIENPEKEPNAPGAGFVGFYDNCAATSGWSFNGQYSPTVINNSIKITTTGGSQAIERAFTPVEIPENNHLTLEMGFSTGAVVPVGGILFPGLMDSRGGYFDSPIQGQISNGSAQTNGETWATLVFLPSASGNGSVNMLKPNHKYKVLFDMNFETNKTAITMKDYTYVPAEVFNYTSDFAKATTNGQPFTQFDRLRFIPGGTNGGELFFDYVLLTAVAGSEETSGNDDGEPKYNILYENDGPFSHSGGGYATTAITSVEQAENLTYQYDVNFSNMTGDIKCLPTLAKYPYVAQNNNSTPSVVATYFGNFVVQTRHPTYAPFNQYGYTAICPVNYGKEYRITVTMCFEETAEHPFGEQEITIYNLTDDTLAGTLTAPLSSCGDNGQAWVSPVSFGSFSSLSGNYNGASGSLNFSNVSVYTIEYDNGDEEELIQEISQILYSGSGAVTHNGGDYRQTAIGMTINAVEGLTYQYDVDMSGILADNGGNKNIKALPTLSSGPYVAQVNEHTPSIISTWYGNFAVHTRQAAYAPFNQYSYVTIAPVDFQKTYRITVTMSFSGKYGEQKITIYNLTDNVSEGTLTAPLSASGAAGSDWANSILFKTFNSLNGNYNGVGGSLNFSNISVYVKNIAMSELKDDLVVLDNSSDTNVKLRVKAINENIDVSGSKMYIISYGQNNQLTSIDVAEAGAVDGEGFTAFAGTPPTGNYSVMLWNENVTPYIKVIRK